MAAILLVRIETDLEFEELMRRVQERRPQFCEVPGLIQKIYAQDAATGHMCGIYFFEDQSALEAFRETELAKTIPSAYEATDIQRSIFEVLYPLYPDRGPFIEKSG